jgi:hypothetical protein
MLAPLFFSRSTSRMVALSLLGWYLMAPPIENLSANLSAPISRWDTITSYDSAYACETQRRADVDRMQKVIEGEITQGKPVAEGAREFAGEQCVATDDPRLKDK